MRNERLVFSRVFKTRKTTIPMATRSTWIFLLNSCSALHVILLVATHAAALLDGEDDAVLTATPPSPSRTITAFIHDKACRHHPFRLAVHKTTETPAHPQKPKNRVRRTPLWSLFFGPYVQRRQRRRLPRIPHISTHRSMPAAAPGHERSLHWLRTLTETRKQ